MKFLKRVWRCFGFVGCVFAIIAGVLEMMTGLILIVAVCFPENGGIQGSIVAGLAILLTGAVQMSICFALLDPTES